MGDRGNIVIRQEKDTNRGDVWFYGHWSGYRLHNIVQTALAKHWRWTDHSYLARIVFDVMVGDRQGSETSFGISTTMGDNEYPILVVDCPAQTVYEIPESIVEKSDNRLPDDTSKYAIGTRSFEQFATLASQPEAA